MSNKELTDEELLELGYDPDFDNWVDRAMRAIDDWRDARLPHRSRLAGLLEAVTGTYWMFRMGPCHCWMSGKAFPFGAAKMWRQKHPVLWWYFHVAQRVCDWFHARRDREYEREMDRDIFGEDYLDV